LCLAGIAVLLAWSTRVRTSAWRDRTTLWRDCLTKYPRSARCHNNLGNALKDDRKLDQALYHYSEAVHIRPDYPKGYANMAAVLIEQKRFAEAVTLCAKALKDATDNPIMHYNAGKAFAGLGDLTSAARHYREALRLKPELLEAQVAMHALERRLAENPGTTDNGEPGPIRLDNAQACVDMGLLYARQGRFDKALGQFKAAADLDPRCAEAHNYWGVALTKLDRIEEAVPKFRRALSLAPGYREARANLEQTLRALGRAPGPERMPPGR